MFETLSKCIQDCTLDVKNIVGSAADGAANMQGAYNGFMAFLTEASPEQVKIWCLSHNLNLCIQDTTKSVNESSIFTDLNACATIIKASHKRMDIWKEEVPGNRRVGKIGETRWWSKHDVLGKVF